MVNIMVSSGGAGAFHDNWVRYSSRSKAASIAQAMFLKPLKKHGFIKGSILDVGCSRGEVTFEAAQVFPDATITGLDLTGPYLRLPVVPTEETARSGRVNFHKGDADALPFKDGSFDVVICINVLHTVDNPVALLREIKRVTRPGGLLFIYCMRRSWLRFLYPSLRYGYTADELNLIAARSGLLGYPIRQGLDWITITAPSDDW